MPHGREIKVVTLCRIFKIKLANLDLRVRGFASCLLNLMLTDL